VPIHESETGRPGPEQAAFPLGLETWEAQHVRLPRSGRHVIGHATEDRIVVFQAYGPSIARAAVEAQKLGGEGFGFHRMTWIKPSFLWMMYRCGWASKTGQERFLAIHVPRSDFATWVRTAVATSWRESGHPSEAEWEGARAAADVLVQWDPDRTPDGSALDRRAIQLGLRGPALQRYVDCALAIHDVTDFVRQQARLVSDPSDLLLPRQDVLTLA
jgi:hypothetical protein